IEGVVNSFAMVQEIVKIELKTAVRPEADQAIEEVIVGWLAVGGQAHYLALVTILVVANELAHHGVEDAERMRKQRSVEHFDFVPLSEGGQGGGKVAESVHTQDGSSIKTGHEICAGGVAEMVLHIVDLSTQLIRANSKRLAEKARSVSHLGPILQP